MKLLIAGAFGALGRDLVREAVSQGHDVTAIGVHIREIEGISSKQYKRKQIDVLQKESLKGICEDMDVVITTVGLTKASKVTRGRAEKERNIVCDTSS